MDYKIVYRVDITNVVIVTAALRADGNCTCPTPCVKVEYVPSTSFSIILGPDTSSGVQDEESFELQQKLFKAREIRHRIVQDKYLQTIRNMHIVDYGLKIMVRFFEATRQSLAIERRNVVLNTAQINGDCMKVRDTLVKAKSNIREQIRDPLLAYQTLLESRGQMALEELASSIDELLDAANRYQDNPKNIGDAIGDIILKFFNQSSLVDRGDDVGDLTWTEYVSGVLMEKNNTVWTMYTKMLSSLTLLGNDFHSNLNAAIRNVSLLTEFRLENNRIEPLTSYIGNQCKWCSNSSNSALLEILQTRILAKIDLSLSESLKDARLTLQTAVEAYLAGLLVKDKLRTITGWADPEFYSLMNASRSELQKALDKVSAALSDTQDAEDLIDNLLYYSWELQCQTELKRLAKQYEGGNIFSQTLLDETIEYFYSQYANITSVWDDYMSGSTTLEYTGLRVPFLSIQGVIANRKLRLESLLSTRWLSLYDIHNQIKTIGYTFLTLIDDTHLATTSAYWKAFEMTQVTTSVKDSLDAQGNPLLLPDFYMGPNAIETNEWQGRLDNINTLEANLQTQTELLEQKLGTSSAYFDDYIQNNQLSDEFFS